MNKIKIKINNDDLLKAIDEKFDEIADEIFADSQQIIVDKKIIDEGTLLKSGEIHREWLNKSIIYSVPYAEMVEYGRLPGSLPPMEPLKKWVKRKRIAIKEPELTQVTWRIIKNIKKHGIKPRPYLSPAVEMAKNRIRGK